MIFISFDEQFLRKLKGRDGTLTLVCNQKFKTLSSMATDVARHDIRSQTCYDVGRHYRQVRRSIEGFSSKATVV